MHLSLGRRGSSRLGPRTERVMGGRTSHFQEGSECTFQEGSWRISTTLDGAELSQPLVTFASVCEPFSIMRSGYAIPCQAPRQHPVISTHRESETRSRPTHHAQDLKLFTSDTSILERKINCRASQCGCKLSMENLYLNKSKL